MRPKKAPYTKWLYVLLGLMLYLSSYLGLRNLALSRWHYFKA